MILPLNSIRAEIIHYKWEAENKAKAKGVTCDGRPIYLPPGAHRKNACKSIHENVIVSHVFPSVA